MTPEANTEKKPLRSIYNEAMKFIEEHESVILATSNQDGQPEASYAPVMHYENKFYIYVSELSAHTNNLIGTPDCSLLFIEPESEAKHLFARKRLTIRCNATELKRDSENWTQKIDTMEEKFGEIIQMLRGLEDFHLFEISAESAGYVRGFAQAYKLTGNNLEDVEHQNDRGHGKSNAKEN